MTRGADDERTLTEDVIAPTKLYGRDGYRGCSRCCDAGRTVNLAHALAVNLI